MWLLKLAALSIILENNVRSQKSTICIGKGISEKHIGSMYTICIQKKMENNISSIIPIIRIRKNQKNHISSIMSTILKGSSIISTICRGFLKEIRPWPLFLREIQRIALLPTGSYHESDLQFVFGQPFLGLANTLRGPKDRSVATTIMSVIISFAHTG